jgi:hypothetical protein
MSQWTPKPDMYGPGGGEFIDDTGQVWPDPWGTLVPQAAPTGPEMPASGAGAPPADPLDYRAAAPAPGPTSPVTLNPGTPPTFDPNADPLAPQPPVAPTPTPGFADQKAATPAAAGGAQAPTPTPGFADRPEPAAAPAAPAFVTLTDSKTASSGLDPASAARAQEGIARQQQAQARADESRVAKDDLEARLTATRSAGLLASSAKGLEKVAAEQAVQDHIASEVDRRLNAGGPNSKDAAGVGSVYWRPDRTELFHGDSGVAFGIAAAVAAMAGAWMQGRGLTGSNPYLPTIMKMIDDNVNDQVRQNSTAIQHLKELKGDVKAAKLELRERQLAYTQQQVDGLALRDKSQIMQAGVAGLRDQLTAEREKTRNEQEKVLNRTVTQETSRRMAANPAAKAAQLPRGLAVRYVQNNALQDEYRVARAHIVEAQQSGAAAAYLGTVATHGVSWVQEHLNGLPPEQKKFANALMALERVNHINTGSSLVGLSAEEKERYGHEGIAEKERDIPTMLAHFDEIARLKAKENAEMLRGAGREESGGDVEEDMPEGTF